MNVGDLIAKLQKFDPELEVCIVDHLYGTEPVEEVRFIPEKIAPRVFKKPHVVID